MNDLFFQILGYLIGFGFLGYVVYLFIKTLKTKK